MALLETPKDRDKSYRCATCDINWPKFKCYESCPRCEGDTMPTDMYPDHDAGAAAKIRDAWTAWRSYDQRKPSKVRREACRVGCTCLACIKARNIQKELARA